MDQDKTNTNARYTIIGLDQGLPPILGIWEPASLSFPSFSTLKASERPIYDTNEVVWSVTLPENPALAKETTQSRINALNVVRQAVSKSGETLQKLPAHLVESSSFTPEYADTTNPEARLGFNLAQMTGLTEETGLSYSLPDALEQTAANYKVFIQQTLQLLKPTLRVETRVEGTLMAFTQAELDGNLKTVWLNEVTSMHTCLHLQNISFAMESRLALFQFLAQVVSGAAVIAARFSLPGGAIMALPSVWRYMQDVIKEADKWMV